MRDCKAPQQSNALSPIVCTLFPNVTVCSDVQEQKAPSLIVVILSGIIIDPNEEQPLNA